MALGTDLVFHPSWADFRGNPAEPGSIHPNGCEVPVFGGTPAQRGWAATRPWTPIRPGRESPGGYAMPDESGVNQVPLFTCDVRLHIAVHAQPDEQVEVHYLVTVQDIRSQALQDA